MTSGPLEIYLLGDFRIRIGERIIPDAAWKLRKAAGIVKLLALEPTHRLHREQIMDTLWPELDPDAAANNFRYALHTARRALSMTDTLQRDGAYISLGDPAGIWVDIQAFETDLAYAWKHDDRAAFQSAVDIYQGDLLPNDPYEEWLDTRRTALRTSYLTALGRLARLHEEDLETGAAIATWQQLLQADPASEEAHVQIMLLHAGAGRRREALQQFQMLEVALADELGAQPHQLTQDLAEAIRSGTIPIREPVQHLVRPQPRSTVPTPATNLIGRERELAELRQALTQSRLVSVTGPGGAGKTRTAIEVASHGAESFAGGVWFVPLAPVSDATLVSAAIVQALGVPDLGGEPLDSALTRFLQGQPVLLVLDNFEHVLPAATLVSTLLEACPELTLLTTSRTSLRVRGEMEYPLRALTDDAAAQLFIERSRAVRPGFAPVETQMSAITGICRRLDSLPLAIELAAARSRVLNPDALLERLASPLKLLTGGPRDLPDRQQTLRATIAWSFDLLPADLQVFCRALAVYVGHWTLDEAAAVCPDTLNPLDALTTLVEHSLIEEHPANDEPSFRMLETIREFGIEQLELSGEIGQVRQQHANYYLGLAERIGPELRGHGGMTRHVELAHRHDNLRLALSYALDHDPDRALHASVKIEKYWFTRGSFSEWEYWLTSALQHSSDARPEDRASALHQIAFCKLNCGQIERAHELALESRELAAEHNLLDALGRSTSIIAVVEARGGNPERGQELSYEALEYYRASGNDLAVASQLSNIAVHVTYAGDYERARALFAESLELTRKAGDTFFIVMGLINLAELDYELDNLLSAHTGVEEALPLARYIDARQIIAGALVQRAIIAIEEGRGDDAREDLIEIMEIIESLGESDCRPLALEACAALLLNEGVLTTAATLLTATVSDRQQLGAPRLRKVQHNYEQYVAACRSSMDDSEWDRAVQMGESMSIGAVIDLARHALTRSGQ